MINEMINMVEMNMKKYLCIHLDDKPLEKCYKCCGITNSCGKYENELGLDFEEVLNERQDRQDNRNSIGE